MKEFVFVEFIFANPDEKGEIKKLKDLGEDFQFIEQIHEYEEEDDYFSNYIRVRGRINSVVASLIKLQNPALAGKMRISYIPDELKDKYRK